MSVCDFLDVFCELLCSYIYHNGMEWNIRLGLSASLLAGRIARSPQLFPGPGQPSRKQRPDSSYCFQCYFPITGWRASPAFKCNAGCLGLTIRLFILRYKSLFLQNRNQTTCLGGQLPFITNNKNCTIYGPLKNPINPDGEKKVPFRT